MKIAVIGASGFIGGVVTSRLSQGGDTVTAVYRTEPEGAGDWWRAIGDKIRGDIRDDEIQNAVVSRRPDACIYLVSLNHHDSAGPVKEVASVNVIPIWRLLERLARSGWRGRFIYMSTQQVYGRDLNGIVDEGTTVRPVNYYGLTHHLAEQICRYFSQSAGMETISLRLSNGYGVPAFESSDCWWLVVNQLARMAVKEGVILLKSDGSPIRDFINVEDVARFVRSLISASRIEAPCLNLGSGQSRSIYQVARAVQCEYEARSGRLCEIQQAGKGALETEPESQAELVYSVAKAEELGLRATIPLGVGIKRIFQFLEHQNG